MSTRIRQRLDTRSGQGFTVIELLIAIVIIGILLAIAVPSYFGFRDRAHDIAAKQNIRDALPAIETYHSEFGDYSGMSLPALRKIDQSIELDGNPSATATTYCIQSTVGRRTWSISGPGAAEPEERAC